MVTPEEKKGREAFLDEAFSRISLFAGLLSLFGLGLLAFNLFKPLPFLCAALIALIPAARFRADTRCRRQIRNTTAAGLSIFVIALLARANPGTLLAGGQDPGVYSNVAGHMAVNGSAIIKDEMPGILSDNPSLKSYYFKHSYLRLRKKRNGRMTGLFQPGFSVRDFKNSTLSPQFYQLHPLWLAVGRWVSGISWQGWVLSLFSSLTVVAAFLITIQLTASLPAAAAAGLILAFNPAHSYIGTSPVSESVAGFFFLSATYFFLKKKFLPGALQLTCLFFTRITGFVSLPLVSAALIWIALKRRYTQPLWTGLALTLGYAASFYWGRIFSPIYSSDIYGGKLGLEKLFLGRAWILFVLICGFWLLIIRYGGSLRERLKPAVSFLVRYRTALAIGLILATLSLVLYRGYLLAYTDSYLSNKWVGRRWHMAGQGLRSIRHTSFYALSLMLAPAGLIAFLAGLYLVTKRAILNSKLSLVAIPAIGFLLALTVKQLTVPYLYYFGRYLVSELLPLAVILGSVAVYALLKHFKNFNFGKSALLLLWVVYILSCLSPSFSALRARLAHREGSDFTKALDCVAELTPGKPVILVENAGRPETMTALPLRLTYNKLTFSVLKNDLAQKEKLSGFIRFFKDRGFSVAVLTFGSKVADDAGLVNVLKTKASYSTFRAQRALPRRAIREMFPLELYLENAPEKRPSACLTSSLRDRAA